MRGAARQSGVAGGSRTRPICRNKSSLATILTNPIYRGVKVFNRETGVMDLIRRTLITPKAIREMIDIINEHVRLHGETQAPELERARRQIASLEKQHANLRRALRTRGSKVAHPGLASQSEGATEDLVVINDRDEFAVPALCTI